MTFTRKLLIAIALLATAWLRSASAQDKLTPLGLRQVKAGGEIGRRIDITVNNNLLKLNIDKDFLAPFDKQEYNGINGYIGVGKLIDAAVRFAVYTGDPNVLALKEHIVEGVLQRQLPDGYFGMFIPEKRMAGLWSIHEMVYLVYGLTNDYKFFGSESSLEAAKKIMAYIMDRWDATPSDWSIKELNIANYHATTGIDEACLTLAQVTGDEKYLDFLKNKVGLSDWGPGIRVFERGALHGHVYVYLVKAMIQVDLNQMDPDPKLLNQSREALEFMTHRNGLVVTGACGQSEQWTGLQNGRGQLGETCATAYQIRFYDRLLRSEGKSYYGDLMERTIYNALFAAQSPDGRSIAYFTPFEGKREYFPRDTYCCPNNYRRIIAELPTMVYYTTDAGLAINLYTESAADVELKNGVSVKVKQETDYPNSGRVVVGVSPSEPARFSLKLRIPKWCGTAGVRVNDEAETKAEGGAFREIERRWNAGDKVTVDMPMGWRLVRGRAQQVGRVAVMRGPLVFCLNPAQSDKLADRDGADLSQLTIAPESLSAPVADSSVRPDGLGCRIITWGPGGSIRWSPGFNLVLTEFADPNGKATYFRIPGPDYKSSDMVVDDELIKGDFAD